MNPEVSEIANSPGFWLIGIPMVLVMLFQAYLFMKKAWCCGLKMGMSKEQMMRGLRSGAITSIAPSFSILIALVGLIAIVGGAFAWQRLSVVGSIMYIGFTVQTALNAIGTTVGGSGYTPDAFANCVWVMAIGSGGWLLVTALFTHKLEWVRRKAVRGQTELLPVLTICAILGTFGYLVSKHAVTVSRSTIAMIVGALCVILLNEVSEKKGKKWLKECSLGLAMLAGMFAAIIGMTL